MQYAEFLKKRYNAADETFYDAINFNTGDLCLFHHTVSTGSL
jgi:hypothetical protein